MFRLATVLLFLSSPVMAGKAVKGYFKPNGTVVAPHYRTKADNSRANNWTSQGNSNPYTGKRGTKK